MDCVALPAAQNTLNAIYATFNTGATVPVTSPERPPEHVATITQTLREMVRRYPARGAAIVTLTFLSGLAEALGVVALLPLLGLTLGSEVDIPVVGEPLIAALSVVGLDESVGALLSIIVVGIIAKAGLRYAAMRQAGYATADIGRNQRIRLIRSLMTARWGHFTGLPVGSLANAVSGEAGRASQLFVKSADLLARIIQVSVYLGVAFVVSWQIAIATVVFGAAMAASLNFLVRITRGAAREQTTLMKSLTSRLSDGMSALKPLKAMGRERNLQPFLEQEIEELSITQRRQVSSQAALDAAHEPIITFFVAIIIYAQLVLLEFPFNEVLFIAFLFYRTATYIGTVQKSFQILMTIESAYWSLEGAIVSAERAAERLGGGERVRLQDRVEFDAVSFGYTSTPVLDRASFVIPARRMTAFIGPSGTGKTTIADLVTGLYMPSSGAIRIDGQDLAGADLRRWREQIGYVPQELILFHDSIYANVSMADPEVARDAVERALRLAGAWEFVQAIPDGMDAIVGEHGMRLSGGQRQRLSIARALVREPDLLILDEATTALDPETERAILDTLEELKAHTTLMAISHQRGLVDAADIVIRLEPGPGGASIHIEEPEHS